MTSRYQDRYRIESTRLRTWDYAWAGAYFVTICTARLWPFFGEIVAGVMRLSTAGRIAAEEWERTTLVRPSVLLDEWAVMPTHMHGIVILTDRDPQSPSEMEGPNTPAAWRSGCLGAIVNQYKGACTRRIRSEGDTQFAWQARFWDTVIRDGSMLDDVRGYICRNPAQWDCDRHNPSVRIP